MAIDNMVAMLFGKEIAKRKKSYGPEDLDEQTPLCWLLGSSQELVTELGRSSTCC